MGDDQTKSNRGFASWSPEAQRAVASKGGRAAHAKGSAHQFTVEEARANGRIGGAVVSQNRAHMAEIGRKGGKMRGLARRMAKEAEEEVNQTKKD